MFSDRLVDGNRGIGTAASGVAVQLQPNHKSGKGKGSASVLDAIKGGGAV